MDIWHFELLYSINEKYEKKSLKKNKEAIV